MPPGPVDEWTKPREVRREWLQLLEDARLLTSISESPEHVQSMPRILQGQLEHGVLPSKSIRLFTSSTFTDTRRERNLLMVDVYPYLKLLCKTLGMEFGVVDMRWGVRVGASTTHRTSELCMSEISKCLSRSAGPAFLTLLGDKYGYRPPPRVIPLPEFELLLAQVKTAGETTDDLTTWYLLNENVVPPSYEMVPITNLLPDYVLPASDSDKKQRQKEASSTWWSTFEAMQGKLRRAARVVLGPEEANKYIVSVTQEEVINGVHHNSQARNQSFLIRRHVTGIPVGDAQQSGNVRHFLDLNADTVDADAGELLTALKESAGGKLPDSNVVEFDVEWSEVQNPVQETEYTRAVCDTVCRLIGAGILEGYKAQPSSSDPLFLDLVHHATFARQKATSVFGRDESLQRVSEHFAAVASTPKRSSPLVVWAPSGSGKTTFMAAAALQLTRSELGKDCVLALRFLGTNFASATGLSLLQSLIAQLCRAYGRPVQVPDTFEAATHVFAATLEYASAERPLVLLLDALDQLSDQDRARDLQWLPISLPPFVRLVVSTLPEVGNCLQMLRLSLLRGTAEDKEGAFLRLPALSNDVGEQMLRQWLADAGRTLTTDQRAHVLGAFEVNPKPLLLRLFTDQACSWSSTKPVGECTLTNTVKGQVNHLFQELEDLHGHLFVSRALGYLTASRDGLSSAELEDILSLDDDVLNDVYEWWVPPLRRLPPLLWIRLKNDLDAYLSERASSGVAVWTWFHRQFREAAKERYLSDSGVVKTLHANLVEYFSGRWATEAKPFVPKRSADGTSERACRFVAAMPFQLGPERYNARALSERSFHTIKAGDADAIEVLFTDFDFLRCKLAAGLSRQLYLEFADLMPAKSKLLQDMGTFFFQEAPKIVPYPANLLQHAWNQPHKTETAQAAARVVAQRGERASPLVEWVNKPVQSDPRIKCVMNNHSSPVTHIAWAPDDATLASLGLKDNGIVVYDARTFLTLFTLLSRSRPTDLCYAADGLRLLSTHIDGAVRVWNVRVGALLTELGRDTDLGPAVSGCFLQGDGEGLVVTAHVLDGEDRGGDGHICVWDLQQPDRPLLTVEAPVFVQPKYTRLSVDGSLFAVRREYHGLDLYRVTYPSKKTETESPKRAHVERVWSFPRWEHWFGNDAHMTGSGVDWGTGKDEGLLYVGATHRCRSQVWDVSGLLAGGDGHEPTLQLQTPLLHWLVCSQSWSADGKWLATADGSGLYILKDTERNAPEDEEYARIKALTRPQIEAELQGKYSLPVNVVITKPNKEEECDVLRWRLVHARTQNALGWATRSQTGWIRAMAFSPDSRRLASGSNDGVLVWDVGQINDLRNEVRAPILWAARPYTLNPLPNTSAASPYMFVVCGNSGPLHCFDGEGTLVHSQKVSHWPKGGATSPDGTLYLSVGGGMRMYSLDVEREGEKFLEEVWVKTKEDMGALVVSRNYFLQMRHPAAFSRDSRFCFTAVGAEGADRNGVAVWEAQTGKLCNVLPHHDQEKTATPSDLVTSPSGRWLVRTGLDGAQLLAVEDGGKALRLVTDLLADQTACLTACWTPDERTLLVATKAGPIHGFTVDMDASSAASSSNDSPSLTTSSSSSSSSSSAPASSSSSASSASSSSSSSSSAPAASSASSAASSSSSPCHSSVVLSGHTAGCRQLRLQHGDDNILLSASDDATVRAWDLSTGAQLFLFTAKTSVPIMAPIDEHRVFAADNTGGVYVLKHGL